MWDPRPWVQARPSYPRAIAAPTAGPCDPPLVCVSFNAQYVPFVAGALSQLTQRTTWLAPDEDTLQGTLANMTWLLEIIGTAVQCNAVPAIPGVPTAQQACNLSGYIANFLIRQSMKEAIASIQSGYDVLNYGLVVMRFIPGFGGIFGAALTALNALYGTISSGTLADYQTAVDDDTLWGLVTCAVYSAIATDGQVTTANYTTIVSNVCAIPYTLTDVVTAICDFVTHVGVSGLQAVQPPGALASYDCTHCGTGPALGPVGPQPRQIAGTDFLHILPGLADAALTILFPTPFPSPPLLTAGVDNEDVVASFRDTTATGTTLLITSAVPAAATMAANVDWIALPPGTE